MPARPFHPSMNRRRRQIPGHWHALALALVIVGGAWGGQHGLGDWIGGAVGWSISLAWTLAVRTVGAVAWLIGCLLVAGCLLALVAAPALVRAALDRDQEGPA